jgi:simple sugar transport system permease protein
LYLAGSGKYIEVVDVLPSEGFDGIPVALLGLSNPIAIIFSGLFIAYIRQGGFYMQLYNFVPEIIDIIIAIIIYSSAFSLIIRLYINRKQRAKIISKEMSINENKTIITEDKVIITDNNNTLDKKEEKK